MHVDEITVKISIPVLKGWFTEEISSLQKSLIMIYK